jgi:hypothetical protein
LLTREEVVADRLPRAAGCDFHGVAEIEVAQGTATAEERQPRDRCARGLQPTGAAKGSVALNRQVVHVDNGKAGIGTRLDLNGVAGVDRTQGIGE